MYTKLFALLSNIVQFVLVATEAVLAQTTRRPWLNCIAVAAVIQPRLILKDQRKTFYVADFCNWLSTISLSGVLRQFQRRAAVNTEHDAAFAPCDDCDWFILSILRMLLKLHWFENLPIFTSSHPLCIIIFGPCRYRVNWKWPLRFFLFLFF